MKKLKKYNVFVYGTLKKGHGNNHFLEYSQYIGQGSINADMYSYGCIPVCVPSPCNKVKGEVYRVTKQVLKRIDGLEGHPVFYQRQEVNIVLSAGNEVIKGYCYFQGKGEIIRLGLSRVISGFW